MDRYEGPPPYIGMTGFMSAEEVVNALTYFDIVNRLPVAAHDNLGRQLMCGVLASGKMLEGFVPDNPKRYPPLSDLAKIFAISPLRASALLLVHYHTTEPGLCEQLMRVCEATGRNLHGFQLNIAWPDPVELTRFMHQAPQARMVIQVGREAYDLVGRSPMELVDRLEWYRGVMTDVLFDLSGGEGRPLDLEAARAAIGALQARFGRQYGIGVAGGLGPETIERIQPLLAEFPRLSFDAEDGLRDVNDDLDASKWVGYLTGGSSLIADPRPTTRKVPRRP